MSILERFKNQSAKIEPACLKVGLYGIQGSGKTRTAAEIAYGLCERYKLKEAFMLDSETGGRFIKKLLADRGITLNVIETRAFSDLVEAFVELEKAYPYHPVIVDSITHFWEELKETTKNELKKSRLQLQDYQLINPKFADFSYKLTKSKIHVILCGREQIDTETQEKADGTEKLAVVGTRMKAQKEIGYEPSLTLHLYQMQIPSLQNELTLAKIRKQEGLTTSLEQAIQWCSDNNRSAISCAEVEKDRTDRLQGKMFFNLTFKNIEPHIDFLETSPAVAVSTNTSADLIDKDDIYAQSNNQRRRQIALEEIQIQLTKAFPSRSADDNRAKVAILEQVLGTANWPKIEIMPIELLDDATNNKDGMPSKIQLAIEIYKNGNDLKDAAPAEIPVKKVKDDIGKWVEEEDKKRRKQEEVMELMIKGKKGGK